MLFIKIQTKTYSLVPTKQKQKNSTLCGGRKLVRREGKGKNRNVSFGVVWMDIFLSIHLQDSFMLKTHECSILKIHIIFFQLYRSGFAFSHASLERQLLLWTLILLARKVPVACL
jgi:hypothetical protein